MSENGSGQTFGLCGPGLNLQICEQKSQSVGSVGVYQTPVERNQIFEAIFLKGNEFYRSFQIDKPGLRRTASLTEQDVFRDQMPVSEFVLMQNGNQRGDGPDDLLLLCGRGAVPSPLIEPVLQRVVSFEIFGDENGLSFSADCSLFRKIDRLGDRNFSFVEPLEVVEFAPESRNPRKWMQKGFAGIIFLPFDDQSCIADRP